MLSPGDIATGEVLACSALWARRCLSWWCWWRRAWCWWRYGAGRCRCGRWCLCLHPLEHVLAKEQATPGTPSGRKVNRNATLGAIDLGGRVGDCGELLGGNSLPGGREIRHLLLHPLGCLGFTTVSSRTTEKAAIRAVFGPCRNSTAASGATGNQPGAALGAELLAHGVVPATIGAPGYLLHAVTVPRLLRRILAFLLPACFRIAPTLVLQNIPNVFPIIHPARAKSRTPSAEPVGRGDTGRYGDRLDGLHVICNALSVCAR